MPDSIRLAGVGGRDILLHLSKDKLLVVDGNDHEWPWQPTDWMLAFCLPVLGIIWLRSAMALRKSGR